MCTALAGALAAFGASAISAAAQSAYIVDAAQRFGTMDLATGQFLAIGPGLPQGTTGLTTGAHGSLLSLTFSGDLIEIDPSTGVTRLIGPTGFTDCSTPSSPCGPKTGSTLTGFRGAIYATDFQNNLYTLNPLTGAATLVGATGIPAVPFTPGFPTADGTLPFYDQALFSVGDALFSTFDAAILDFETGDITSVIAPSLYQINAFTGRATRIAATALGLHAALGVGGIAYAFDSHFGTVVTLGLTDGQTREVSSFGDPGEFIITGATVATTTTPEPASVGLVGLGLVVIGAYRRRVRLS
ncbi:MAG: PEP-CTERM sorting domain-containing protein [Gemmatimonadota bacterium]|nr:PEP-CTERM sorting domain-containing protein [Gemmatimonadota bacterium]